MSDIILFGDCAGTRNIDLNLSNRYYIKSAALLRLSHYLRRRGHTVFCVHHSTSFTIEEIETILKSRISKNTKIVGISTSFISPIKIRRDNKFSNLLGINPISAFNDDEFDRIQAIIKISKALSPNIKVVMGGHEIFKTRFNKNGDMALWRFNELKDVDYFVNGQHGEIVLDMLLKNNIPQIEMINGYKFIDGNKFRVHDFSQNAAAPAPGIDGINYGESLITELGYGCIFNCEFCDRGITGKKKNEYMRSRESVMTEFRYNYKNFGTTFYTFLDDMMNDNVEKTNWLTEIKNEIPDLEWSGYVRLDVMNDDNIKLLKNSGIIGFYIGLETFKKDIGPLIGKMTDPIRMKELLRLIRNNVGDDVLIKASLIAGLPTETQEEFKETLNWILYSDEGQYLIDRITATPLHVFKTRKGGITNRGEPFKDYIIDESISKEYSAMQNWSSPWGNREEWAKLIADITKNKPQQFFKMHPFYFIMYKNMGIDLRSMIKSYRDKTYSLIPTTEEMIRKNLELINNYKSKIVKITDNDIIDAHKKFWETFPVIQETPPKIIPIALDSNLEELELSM